MFLRSSAPTRTSGTAIPAASSNNLPRIPKLQLLNCNVRIKSIPGHKEAQKAQPVLAKVPCASLWQASTVDSDSHFLLGYGDDWFVQRRALPQAWAP